MTMLERKHRERVRRAFEGRDTLHIRIDTPNGYERVEVTEAGSAWPVPMLIQYWKQERNLMTFRNFDNYAEWEAYLRNDND